jgi:hypothetical protein
LRENLDNLTLRSRIISGYGFFNEFREIKEVKEVKEIGADANNIFLKLLNCITFPIFALSSFVCCHSTEPKARNGISTGKIFR